VEKREDDGPSPLKNRRGMQVQKSEGAEQDTGAGNVVGITLCPWMKVKKEYLSGLWRLN